MGKLINKIKVKIGGEKIFSKITRNLTGSEFNSLLIDIFRQRTAQITPTDLMKQFEENRFVKPSSLDPLKAKSFELEWLSKAKEIGFNPILLSPLAPLGSCAAVGTVSQNKIISASRGTEVLADATNMLALQIAKDFRKNQDKTLQAKYVTTHQHVRAQFFDNPAFTAHFAIFCMASGAYDRGNYEWEAQSLYEHIHFHYQNLCQYFDPSRLSVKVYFKDKAVQLKSALARLLVDLNTIAQIKYERPEEDNKYYQDIQFKVFLQIEENKIDLADGGLVDWSQKLIPNNKHKMVISGCGIELVLKFLELYQSEKSSKSNKN
ncbi:hypothetical protein [Flexithrix dorotheae]|uniref:hypothetical protein n=1 Tax=Flexithrix dorotheae TaxID=70993 RepID=UPI0003617847|nr:hypothetical protein [Flexithrix dorotheae]